ncbi:dual specificity tyrosine-phosphorylation-regulated kinase 3-like [Acanthochromis polyacanthus]|uniref:dual specificity tyrosine-phosphorylation-regulated kinase 3-like n=1 Tax=Acanthochromis polyacanthus TaxID=80966 RepID=UPI00223421F6|nr:dual specificity tyrosine-phosphorylation-regulated kinase 3-like [Acanthochromis polyacanthus]
MKKLVSHNSKQSNIIDYKGDVFIKNERQLVFEKLDISLAPEIILGLPYSEAIDIWSLGCVMVRMMTSDCLFGTDSEYWTRPTECFGTHFDDAVYQFSSLDEIETVCSETDNLAEADERKECIELLKAMLQWDEKDRITPSGILKHPFITRSYLSSNSPTSSCDEPRPSTSLSITVKPADPENRINLTGLPDEKSDLKSSEHEDSDTAKDIENSKDSDNDEDTQVNKKEQTKTKKKNCFQRIFSWRKKTFCCCCCVQV